MTYFHQHSNSNTIWVESPCTLPYVSRHASIEKTKRFHYNSIYYKDDPFQPARKIDEFQKPDLLLLEFRRQIREASRKPKNIRPVPNHEISKNPSNTSLKSFPAKTIEIVDRLYPKQPKRLKLMFDSHGNRSTFLQDLNYDDLKQSKGSKFSCKSKANELSFTEGPRMDLAKPDNFNPGPGSYFTKTSKGKPLFSRQKRSLDIR